MKKCYLDYEKNRTLYDDCLLDYRNIKEADYCSYAEDEGIEDKESCRHWRDDPTVVCACCGQRLPEAS